MQVQVSGKHMSVGDALRERITDELTASIGKFFERGGDADVVVSKDGHNIKVDCRVVLASGQQLVAAGEAGDAHVAFTTALEKIAKRIRRYKRRLKDHHAAEKSAIEPAPYTILRAPDDEDEEEDGWVDEGLVNGAPAGVIVAETQAEVRTMTVSMAVMQLDLTEGQAIVFRNAAHGGLGVVYRRTDGNIGWIDPERGRASTAA